MDQEIVNMLNQFDRSSHQKEIHDMFLKKCIPLIFGDQHHFKDEMIEVPGIFCCPRRFGKTYAVAMFAAVMALQLGIEISIFSLTQYTSIRLMRIIREYIDKLGEESKIVSQTNQVMVVKSINGKTSQINIYPCDAETLQNVSGDLLIMDEFAQTDDDGCFWRCIYGCIVPLLQLKNTVLLGVSTLTSEDHFMTKLIDEQKDGKPLFDVTRIFAICPECCKDGVTLENMRKECKHEKPFLPNWISPHKREQMMHMHRIEEKRFREEINKACKAS